jgi:hypothetical protein
VVLVFVVLSSRIGVEFTTGDGQGTVSMVISANGMQKHGIPGTRERQGGTCYGREYVEKGGGRRKTSRT